MGVVGTGLCADSYTGLAKTLTESASMHVTQLIFQAAFGHEIFENLNPTLCRGLCGLIENQSPLMGGGDWSKLQGTPVCHLKWPFGLFSLLLFNRNSPEHLCAQADDVYHACRFP